MFDDATPPPKPPPAPRAPASPARLAALARSIVLAHFGPEQHNGILDGLMRSVRAMDREDRDRLQAEIDRLIDRLNEGDAV
jgi:hypothetical protein